jgi:sugar O-acyltransferase (sialic acid O-acetyltransferase NeuD family)
MAEPLVVIGAGGFGREVLDVVDAVNAQTPEPAWRVLGVVDDGPTEENLARLKHRGVEFLGSTDEPLEWLNPVHYVVGIGSPRVRRMLADRYDAVHLRAATLVHPAATQGFDVEIGEGTVICAGVRLTTNIRLGRHVHLNLNATVGHDSTLGDFVSVNPLASVSGDCVVEDDVLIGVGAVVLNQLTVGLGAVIGGCACVVRDVSPDATVKGVPAR